MDRKSSSGMGAFIAAVVVILVAVGVIKAIPAILKGMVWILILGVVLLILIVIAVIVFALKGSDKKKEPVEMSDNKSEAMKRKQAAAASNVVPPPEDEPKAPPLTVEQENILTKGRANLLELRKIIVKIKDPEIHQMSGEICDINEKILKTLREKPEKIPEVRQFLNYYLPTLGEILVKYERIEKSGVPKEKSEKMVEKYLADIKKAMEKQYENLYEDDKLDLSVEMEAMTIAAKSDGLITDDDYKIEDGDHEISLTL